MIGKVKIIVSVLTAGLLAAACGKDANAQNDDFKAVSHLDGQAMISGSGNLVERKLEIGRFEQLAIDGPVDVVVRQGPTRSLAVRAEDNIIDMVRAKILNGTLSLTTKGSFRSRTGIIAVLTVPALESVQLNSDGDVLFENWKADQIELDLGGSGDIRMAGEVTRVRAMLGGSGHIDLTPARLTSAAADIEGSGSIRLGSLQRLDATIDGSGIINADAVDELDAVLNGSGAILYNAAKRIVRQEQNGSGIIARRQPGQ